MTSNRRSWLKHIGLGVAGIGLANFKSLASPTENFINFSLDNDLPVKLRSNENPYGPSPFARTAFAQNVNISNRYNWELTSELITALSKKNNLTPDNILLGAGSTEILDLVARYCASKKGNFIIADPSYAYWTDPVEKFGFTKISVPLTKDKKTDLEAMLKAVNSNTKLVYICNPNNPTGTICEREALVKFINQVSKNVIILVDEAYIDFTTEQSLCNLVNDNQNLVIAKTFSKIYGLAGARIGYGIANKTTIEKLSELQSWVNGSVSVASTAAAIASLKDQEFVSKTYSLNESVRKYTIDELQKLNLRCIPSYSNFIYFSLANYKKDFFKQLADNSILGTRFYEEEGKWTRITIGTKQEMEKFIKAIQ